jgi:orotate phosphoribosyltransferase
MPYSKKVAASLIECEAIRLQPDKPFTWASGWHSPIYCDNRKTLSFPAIRSLIRDAFADVIKKEYGTPDLIAGVATGAIAQGALVSDAMQLPFVYVRSTPKSHGMENLIEGNVTPGQRVVVVEDLISTGGSSLKAVEALRNAGCIVEGMVAIFTYGFPVAEENFEKAGCKLVTLSNYSALLELALESNYINAGQLEVLKQWRKSPDTWMK